MNFHCRNDFFDVSPSQQNKKKTKSKQRAARRAVRKTYGFANAQQQQETQNINFPRRPRTAEAQAQARWLRGKRTRKRAAALCQS